jgi:hypothetical protein
MSDGLHFVGHGGHGSMLSNPLVWGVALAGGVMIVLLTRGTGGGSGAQLSAVSLQAADAANVQLSGLALQGHEIDMQANASNFAASQTTMATLAGQAFSFLANAGNNATSLASQSAQIKGAITINEDNQGAAVMLDQQANANRVSLATIGANQAVNLAGIGAKNSTDLATINANATLGLQSLKNALSSLVLGNNVQLAQIDATSKLALTNAQIGGTLAYGAGVTVPLASINAGVQTSIASTNANAAMDIASTNADAAEHIAYAKAVAGIVSSVAGGGGGGGGGGGTSSGGGSSLGMASMFI